MILAFSPEQAQEVAQAFGVAQQASDASWWMNEALYPDHIQKGNADTSKEQEDDQNAAMDTKVKASPENSKKACRPNNKNRKNKATFQPCFRYHQAARCRRQANNQVKCATKTIEQRTPIHMHPETPHAAKMSLDVTGFNPSDISISIKAQQNYVVSIQGERTNKLGDVFVLDRRFRLDKNTADLEQVTATFEDGILELTVPKKAIAGPRKIPIVVIASKTEAFPIKKDIEEEKESAVAVAVDSADEKEQERETIAVETVHDDDDKATIEEETQTADITAIKPGEDEAWEEVLE